MSKQRVNTLLLATTLLVGGSTFLSSCTSNDTKQVSQEGQRAYENLKTYEVEAQTNPVLAAPDTFATRLAAAQRYSAEYDTAQQAEIRRIEERYNQMQSGAIAGEATASTDTMGAMMATEEAPAEAPAPANEAPAKLYKASSPAAAMTAATARPTYEAFVQRVKANLKQYDIGDWRVINAEWRALDEKYEQVKGDVSGRDKAEISKEKLKYAAFKSFDKTKSRGSQVGDVVTGDGEEAKAKGGGVKLGQTAGNVGSDVKQVGKDVAETGKDVGKGAVKVGKKVGGAVKDVFDGKDDKKD